MLFIFQYFHFYFYKIFLDYIILKYNFMFIYCLFHPITIYICDIYYFKIT